MKTKLKKYANENSKRERTENCIKQKELHHFNKRFDIDYRRIYIDERRGEYPCRLSSRYI